MLHPAPTALASPTSHTRKPAMTRRLTAPLRGLLMYGFNRQMTFRRWRRPAPRIKRGEAY